MYSMSPSLLVFPFPSLQCVVLFAFAAGYTPGVVYSTGEGQEGRGGRLMVKTNTKFVNSEIRRLESSFESTVSDTNRYTHDNTFHERGLSYHVYILR